MSALIWILGALIVMAGAGWLLRAVGQKVTNNAPKWRDMPFAVAFGYVVAAAAILAVLYAFVQAYSSDPIVANTYFYAWFVIVSFIFFAVVAWLFRLLGRAVGTAGSRKLFRQMPLTASFGIITILVYAFVAIFADFLAPFAQDAFPGAINVAPGGDPATGGDPNYLLGTDKRGGDILSRIIYGAQNTVGIAFITTLLAFFIGGTLGFLAAIGGGWIDQVLSRGIDVLMAIPSLIFSLLLMTIALVWADGNATFITVSMIIIIAVIDSTRVFRLSRAVGLGIVVMDYIEAARLRGEKFGYVMFREILPNATAPLLAEFGLRFCFVFLTIASLSFLGVGIQAPLADWGSMVRDGAPFIQNLSIINQEWVLQADEATLEMIGIDKMVRQASLPLIPAAAIALLTVAVNFVVDWMLHRSSGLKE